jgi:hypothetical protein
VKALFLALFAIALCLSGCCASTEVEHGPACFTATPEAGADVSLCPAGALIITECDQPAPNPLPQEGDCTETAYRGGRVWCCAAPAPKYNCEAYKACVADKTAAVVCDAEACSCVTSLPGEYRVVSCGVAP